MTYLQLIYVKSPLHSLTSVEGVLSVMARFQQSKPGQTRPRSKVAGDKSLYYTHCGMLSPSHGIWFPVRGVWRVELNFRGRVRGATAELCGRLPGLLQAECAARGV